MITVIDLVGICMEILSRNYY